MPEFMIRPMSPEDYDEVRALWERSPGVGLSSADSREGVESYLEANQGLSRVAVSEEKIVGAVLCGHDGRRGYISHLAVEGPRRRTGIATALADACIEALAAEGIEKCHVLVFRDNDDALAFYRDNGWHGRDELVIMSRFTCERSEP
jgi:putative acetyltransferase